MALCVFPLSVARLGVQVLAVPPRDPPKPVCQIAVLFRQRGGAASKLFNVVSSGHMPLFYSEHCPCHNTPVHWAPFHNGSITRRRRRRIAKHLRRCLSNALPPLFSFFFFFSSRICNGPASHMSAQCCQTDAVGFYILGEENAAFTTNFSE